MHSPPQTGDVVTIAIWFALAAVAAVVGFAVVVAVRRWAQREERTITFTFQDLRDMRARGEITEHEFAAMRTALLKRMEVDLESDSGPASTEEAPPDAPPAR